MSELSDYVVKHHKKSKYRNRPTRVRGIRFASKKEGRYYQWLASERAKGNLLYFLRQVPFDLPGGIVYRVDFMEVRPTGIVFTDVKGFRTETYRLKKKLVESLYGVAIEEV